MRRQTPSEHMKSSNNPVRLILEILALVAVLDLFLVWLLPAITAGWTPLQAALLQAVLLVLLAGPVVYWRCIIITRNASEASRPDGYVRQSASLRSAVAATLAAQVAGLVLTALAAWSQEADVHATAQGRFDRAVDQLETEAKRRLDVPLFGLTAVRAAYAASEEVTAQEFRELVYSLDMQKQFAGVDAFSFVERVMRSDLIYYQNTAVQKSSVDFNVKTSGDAPDLFVVRHIEPLIPNIQAWGYDLGQERSSRNAMEAALDNGEAALSGQVGQMQTGGVGKALTYALPVFRAGADPTNAQQRRAALKGFIVAPLRMQVLMAGLEDASPEPLAIEMYVGHLDPQQGLLFEARAADIGAAPSYRTLRSIVVGGQVVALRITATPAFDAAQDHSGTVTTVVSGVFASLLLSLATWLLASGRLRAQNAARRMTAELATMARVVQTTDNAVLITDPQLRITWVNAGFTRMSGYTLQEAHGHTPAALLGSDKTPPEVLRVLSDAAAAGGACRVDVVNRAKDGSEYWLNTDVHPTHDEQGVLTGFMEIGTDITAQKRIEADLITAQRNLTALADRLNLAVEGGNDGLWSRSNLASDEEWWSPTYYSLVGYRPDELASTSTNFLSLVHPDHVASVREASALALYHGKPLDHEFLLRTKHQGYRWFRSRAKVFRDSKGNPDRMAGSLQDIHNRKMAEAEVERSAALLRGSISALDGAYALFDPQDKLVICNDRFVEMHKANSIQVAPGITFSELLRSAASQGLMKDAIGREDAWFEECVARHQQPYSVDQQVQQDGRVMRFTDTRMATGHNVIFAVDVTQLVNASEAAEAASRSKSQFLANMSHEIRTPMNAILGMLKLLQNTELTGTQRDYAGKTEGAARSLLGLLNDILDFSKVEAGKMTLDPRPFRIDKLLRDLAVILSSNTSNKQIEVLFDIDPALPRTLVADDMRLQQVLINLGGNAIKFTSQGEVVLGIKVLEQTATEVLVEFSVKDSGIGIAPESQDQIFSGFTQAEASTTRRFGGTGLGLAISSRLVRLLGGEMHLESAPGKGSNFSFQLRMDRAADAELPLPLAPAQTTAQRTLVVDDNAIARSLMVAMARSLGWQVDAAESGMQALERVKHRVQEGNPYDAVFVDWQMPDMDGWETTARIREYLQTQPGQAMPMIFMVTAHGRDMLEQKTAHEQSSLHGFLVKPVTASVLLDAVMDGKSSALTAASGHNPTVLQKPERLMRLQGMRLLVVEDNKINQVVAHGLLTQEGAIVTLADNGQLGVDAVMSMQPAYDVVLMDLQMPVMDGFEATRVIRQTLGLGKLPIIAMTANAMASDREACLKVGMNDHVGKPFELDHLVATLQKHSGWVQAPQAAKPHNTPPPAVPQALPGDLDQAGALARVGGNASMYASVLVAFAADMVLAPEQLRAHLAAKDFEQAVRALHTLKGLAATVGARHLSQVAAQLEKAIKEDPASQPPGHMVHTLRHAIDALAKTLEPVLAASARANLAPESQGPASNTVNQAQLVSDLGVLIRLLKSSDMVAMEVFAMVDQTFGTHLQATLDPLRAAMNSLNFAEAAQQCQALLQSLEVKN
jgi:PAS domain S-box-containing protein